MKKTYTIAAIAMFAVILGMSALSPAMAAKPDKADKIWVCHFEDDEEVIDLDTGLPTGEIISAHYSVIHISENGWNGHQNHEDVNGVEDFRDEVTNDEVVVRAECDVRTAALEAVDPAPEDLLP